MDSHWGAAPAPDPLLPCGAWRARRAHRPHGSAATITPVGPVTEAEIRALVRAEIVSLGPNLAVDEFVVSESARIDLAVIAEDLWGYEFKSDLDTLTRLPRQMQAYGRVFDRCTLVVTDRHVKRARELLRPGWGLGVVRRGEDGTLRYRQVRAPRQIRSVEKAALAQLLRRVEILDALEARSLAVGHRSKPKHLLEERLADSVDLNELRRIVVSALTARQGWRDGRAPRGYGERSPRGGASSRFLARRLR